MSYPVLVGFWRVDGVEHSNETKALGKGAEEKFALAQAIRAQFPDAKEILPIGTKIEIRTEENAFIEAIPGAVIRNIFSNPEGHEDPIRLVGQVWFSGFPYEIVLRHSRAEGCVFVRLHPRLPSTGIIKFSNQLSPQRLLTELPSLLNEVLGSDARDLRLNIREKQ